MSHNTSAKNDRRTHGQVRRYNGCRADRSRAEIERTLQRYGARGFMYGWDETRAVLGFIIHDRQVRFILPLPDRDDPEFNRTATGRQRTAKAAGEAYEQAVRQRWRALALVIKSKLEAVETGIVDFTSEFLAHLVLPSGETVGDAVVPASTRPTAPAGPRSCCQRTAHEPSPNEQRAFRDTDDPQAWQIEMGASLGPAQPA
ncbi:hypothetical protein I553_10793 [Mycobacterium xenopi 4042]|uniref:Uncharacterized protein n=1 Tax=Mycobacterium xenopi 4042 TaxID=1299334 RepID=X8DBQ1_MYCXE|nr:hypothetical protein I553_10793 [Mycobacterium xenopi 4042]